MIAPDFEVTPEFVKDVFACHVMLMDFIQQNATTFGAEECHKAFIYTTIDYLAKETDVNLEAFIRAFNSKRRSEIKADDRERVGYMMLTKGEIL